MEFIQSTEMMEALPCGVAFYELAGEKVLRRGVNTAFAKTLGFDSAEAINACPAEEPLPFIARPAAAAGHGCARAGGRKRL